MVVFIKVFFLWLIQLFFIFLGLFILPFFLNRTITAKNSKNEDITIFKDKWIDYIWGNMNDGIDGDKNYQTQFKSSWLGKINDTWLLRYNWVALRNEIENLSLHMGIDATIRNYKWKGYRYTDNSKGNDGWIYSVATTEDGKKYPMFRYCKRWIGTRGIVFCVGYKNFNIKNTPEHYRYSMVLAFNPIKQWEGLNNKENIDGICKN